MHRDVKPANILVTPDGTVKLTDFGIARAVDGSGHTATGEVLGTPHYLSPEQALGEPATGASDLYSLGVVAHELLTGRRPFEKNTPVATALAQVHDPPPPLPEHVPDALRALVEQCLAKRPEERPGERPRARGAARCPARPTSGDDPDPLERREPSSAPPCGTSRTATPGTPAAAARPAHDPTPTPPAVPAVRTRREARAARPGCGPSAACTGRGCRSPACSPSPPWPSPPARR